MKVSKIFALVLALSLCVGLLAACNNNPKPVEPNAEETGASSTETTEHSDENLDGICDNCEALLDDLTCAEHQDNNEDGVCDICETVFMPSCTSHEDNSNDGCCDFCGAVIDFGCTNHTDTDNDSRCDSCGERLYEDCTHVDADEDFICDKCLLAL